MSKLIYLVDEIRAALEIYYSGRTGGQYCRTAFILCDDYTELVSKLFLLTDNPNWSDTRPSDGRFKNYHDIQTDVRGVFAAKPSENLPQVQGLHDRMSERRQRRNDFFHSTHLLDLSVTSRNCVEAFCDLLDYGELLFGADWQREISNCHDFETLGVLLRLEKFSFSDATIWPKVCRILKDWPRRDKEKRTISKIGTQYAEYPEDMHLRLCVIWGGYELRDRLKALLTAP